MRRFLLVLFGLAIAGVPMVALAQSAPAPPVSELVTEALARSPALAALRSGAAASRALEPAAGALPDPMIEAMVIDARFPSYTLGKEEMSMAGVEIRQGLPYPGKRRARREAAVAETARQAAAVDSLARRIRSEVRSLYARLYAVDHEIQTLAAAHEMLEMLAATTSARYSAGEGEQEPILKAQLQVTRLDEQLDDRRAERAALVADLNRWLDRSGAAPLGEVAELPAVHVPAGSWEEAAVAGSAEVRVAAAALAAAEKKLAAARLDLKPDFAPAAGIAARGGFGPVLTLRLGIELPLWKKSKQEPMINAAELEVEAARSELRDAEAMARTAAASAAARWSQAERLIVRFREGILLQSGSALDAARTSYLNGRGDFSTVTEDFNLWLDARMQLARREADRFTAWAELEKLTGEGELP